MIRLYFRSAYLFPLLLNLSKVGEERQGVRPLKLKTIKPGCWFNGFVSVL